MWSRAVTCALMVTLVLSSILVSGAVASENDDYSVQTLRGLSGIYILVTSESPDLVNSGITRETVLRETKQAFDNSGINILSLKESFQEKGRPYLEVDITTAKTPAGDIGYSLEVSLNQEVRLTRTSIIVHTQTWRARETGGIKEGELPSLLGRTRALVERFAEDYDVAQKGGSIPRIRR